MPYIWGFYGFFDLYMGKMPKKTLFMIFWEVFNLSVLNTLSGGLAFFYNDPFAQLRRHRLHIANRQPQFTRYLFIGKVQPHEIQANYPHSQRLMMSLKDRSTQIVKLLTTGFAFVALTIVVTIMPSSFFDVPCIAFRTFHPIRQALFKVI